MNKTTFNKIAAGVAVAFSLLSIIEGTQVLLGISKPDYIVLTPLIIYNVIMGIVGLFVGVTLWVNHRKALTITTIVVATHLIVLLVVGVIYVSNDAVAMHSVQAMTIRVVVWLVIALITWKASQANKVNTDKIEINN